MSKTRYYDVETGKVIGYIGIKDGFYFKDFSIEYEYYEHNMEKFNLDIFNQEILCQCYTGVKDCDGVEIYKDDVVVVNTSLYGKFIGIIVEDCEDKFIVDNVFKNLSSIGSVRISDAAKVTNIKVIGTIFDDFEIKRVCG